MLEHAGWSIIRNLTGNDFVKAITYLSDNDLDSLKANVEQSQAALIRADERPFARNMALEDESSRLSDIDTELQSRQKVS